MQSVRFLVLARYFEPAYLGGGPIQTLSALLRAKPKWALADVVCSNLDLGVPDPIVLPDSSWIDGNGPFRVRHVSPTVSQLLRILTSGALKNKYEFLYINSFFDPLFSLLPQFLLLLGFHRKTRILLAPRGEIDPGALAIKPLRKRALLTLYRLLGCQRRVSWHVSSSIEAQNLRSIFRGDLEIIVRENETRLPREPTARAERKAGPMRLIFASRISPKKGLHVLLEALQNVSIELSLRVVGKFEDEVYESQCMSLASAIPDIVNVEFLGGMEHEDLFLEFQQADLFCFPTAGENFGHVIAEALSQQCPVLISGHTMWTDLMASGAGKVAPSLEPRAWSALIQGLADLGPATWSQMSETAKDSYIRWRTSDAGPHVFQLAVESPSLNAI